MLRTISEPDWKRFRRLRELALERFYQRVLGEVERVSSDAEKTAHDRYHALFGLLRRRDEELANAFDNPRRSMAFQQLAWIVSLGLLTPEELAELTLETREVLNVLGILGSGE